MSTDLMVSYQVPKYNYPAQFDDLHATLLPRIEALLLEGDYVLGDAVGEFESRLAQFLGGVSVTGVNSGTDALILTLDALDVGHADEVVTVANSFHATAQAIMRCGAIPVFVDCRDDDFLIDLEQAEQAITDHTRALLVVHLFGKAVDVARAQALCDARGLLLVEDCAQAIGARSGGVRVGTHSAAGCWSFAPAKNLAAAGDGGAVSTPIPELAQRLRLLRHFGQAEQNRHEVLGYNSRLDTIQALVLLHKLGRVDSWNAARQKVAMEYRLRLEGLPLRFQLSDRLDEHVYHLFQVRVEHRTVRDSLVTHLQRLGVDAVVRYPVPLHLQPAFSPLGYAPRRFPVAEALAQETLCLPIRPDLSIEEISYVCDAVQAFFASSSGLRR